MHRLFNYWNPLPLGRQASPGSHPSRPYRTSQTCDTLLKCRFPRFDMENLDDLLAREVSKSRPMHFPPSLPPSSSSSLPLPVLLLTHDTSWLFPYATLLSWPSWSPLSPSPAHATTGLSLCCSWATRDTSWLSTYATLLSWSGWSPLSPSPAHATTARL
jgi:hypothetical protein